MIVAITSRHRYPFQGIPFIWKLSTSFEKTRLQTPALKWFYFSRGFVSYTSEDVLLVSWLLSTESSIVDPNSDWNTLGGICNCPTQFKIQNLIKIITELTTNACLKMVIEQEFSLHVKQCKLCWLEMLGKQIEFRRG